MKILRDYISELKTKRATIVCEILEACHITAFFTALLAAIIMIYATPLSTETMRLFEYSKFLTVISLVIYFEGFILSYFWHSASARRVRRF